jgi:hypothetical protein
MVQIVVPEHLRPMQMLQMQNKFEGDQTETRLGRPL